MSMMVIIVLITQLYCGGYYEGDSNNIKTTNTLGLYDEFEHYNLLHSNDQCGGSDKTRNDFFDQLCQNDFSKQEVVETSEHDIESLFTDASHVNVNGDDLNDYMAFLDNIDFTGNNNVTPDYQPTTFKEYAEDLCTSIEGYIKTSVSVSSQKKYIHRLAIIKGIIVLTGGCTYKDKQTMFTPEIDESLRNMLSKIWSKYENLMTIDDEMYNTFSHDLDKEMFELNDNNIYLISTQKRSQQEFHVLLSEFMKFYDHITLVPELLVLGFALTQKRNSRITTIFHLINIFIEQNKEELKEKKIFVLFLMRKALSYTIKHMIDFFAILKIQETTQSKHSDLYFFTLECGHSLRERIKKRRKGYFRESDRIHYNITLRIFLYQHLVFLKYHKIDFQEFKVFTDEVMRSYKCYGCQFEKYTKLTLEQCNDIHKSKSC